MCTLSPSWSELCDVDKIQEQSEGEPSERASQFSRSLSPSQCDLINAINKRLFKLIFYCHLKRALFSASKQYVATGEDGTHFLWRTVGFA